MISAKLATNMQIMNKQIRAHFVALSSVDYVTIA
jgi:hypothetical protein